MHHRRRERPYRQKAAEHWRGAKFATGANTSIVNQRSHTIVWVSSSSPPLQSDIHRTDLVSSAQRRLTDRGFWAITGPLRHSLGLSDLLTASRPGEADNTSCATSAQRPARSNWVLPRSVSRASVSWESMVMFQSTSSDLGAGGTEVSCRDLTHFARSCVTLSTTLRLRVPFALPAGRPTEALHTALYNLQITGALLAWPQQLQNRAQRPVTQTRGSNPPPCAIVRASVIYAVTRVIPARR